MALAQPKVVPARTGPSLDKRIFLHDVSWEQLEHVLDARGDRAGVRITYLRGELELVSPSTDHEAIKKTLARLIEAYADELGLELNGLGSWTIKMREERLAAEPDECYVLGSPKGRDKPDLAIEVVWTSGGIDKLEVYKGLGVGEVWIWEDGQISVFRLVGDGYEQRAKSALFPGLDLALVERLAAYESQPSAVRELREALRTRGPA
jgi:Uma2 family endonuclease